MRLLYYYLLAFACLHGSLAEILPAQGRGLGDVFGGLESTRAAEGHTEPTAAHAASAEKGISPTALFPGLEQATKTGSKESTAHAQTTTSSLAHTSYSVIGTVPPLPTYTPWSSNTATPSTTSAQTSPTATARSSPAQSITRGIQQWKIVGVAVIAFSVVAAILLLSVFFDQWWGFIRDLVWKKKRKDNFEEFLPDWRRASWEIKADEDTYNRYPSFAGPPRKERVKDPWIEKDDWTIINNVAGVGSGLNPNVKQDPTPPLTQQSTTPNWSLGFLTPVPPPAVLHNDFRDRETSPFDRRKSRAVSTYSDINPYAGIE